MSAAVVGQEEWVNWSPVTDCVNLVPLDSQRERIEIQRMRAPKPRRCSTCQAKTTALVVIQVRGSKLWCGICLWCIDRLQEAAEGE